MQPIIIIGASGHGKVLADIVEQEGRYRLAGFVDATVPAGTEFFGYPVLGREKDLPGLAEKMGLGGCLVAVGDNWSRMQCVVKVKGLAPELPFVSTVHPSARIARGAVVGAATAVMAGAVLGPDVRVGEFCIVNTGACLDHDGVMEDFSSLAPGVVAGGNVRIGTGSAVSLGVRLIHGVTVGAHSVVGAGATVLEDIPDRVLAHGTPARVVRTRCDGERYL
jgi:sugar O-acyltransferase (sialic acid O-acetyltransferase NeuD family)